MGLELRSTVTKEGTLELTLAEVPVPDQKDNEVVVRMEAAPINPSDLGLLLGPADLGTLKSEAAQAGLPRVSATIPAATLGMLQARFDLSMPVGNEGAGVVVKAGQSSAAQALLGKVVGVVGGATYAQYKAVRADQCLVYPEGVTPAQGASWFVNPLTALGMLETMRMEGHKAMVHTAAASNLGQMLAKLCISDGVDLVCVVRKQAQVDLLKGLGCKHVVDSSSKSFQKDLTAAITATGATLGFDATGGGKLAGQLLSCMEAGANAGAAYSRYGSTTYKQVYIYGGLDRSPTVLNRNFGMAWGLGGWLLTPFLQKAGPAVVQKLRERVANEITTTFRSSYSHEVSLAEALAPEMIRAYGKQATGEKFLINPSKGLTPSKL